MACILPFDTNWKPSVLLLEGKSKFGAHLRPVLEPIDELDNGSVNNEAHVLHRSLAGVLYGDLNLLRRFVVNEEVPKQRREKYFILLGVVLYSVSDDLADGAVWREEVIDKLFPELLISGAFTVLYACQT
jgi:hypothetical protein